ncbi:polyprenyl synthetase family protein [Nocardiopsis ansamitocini]|uniref:Geranylgeranyl pyrophosphate synthase n=1 Tax=Nocardiopsis ansamitocini TaxID=1670832 RepID=A0A9W6P2Q0_9ACTN|nr:polyprenyl synthetase family protein [Nocardiopsis ansamitocini]GLU46048.1 geranylgeranyl pyrophosphate synthase [Nocardiopsis ansamitocini]
MSFSHLSPLSFVRPAVDAELEAFVERRRALVLGIGAELRPVLDALDAMITGGKRLRPAFCYWGWRGAGGGEERGIHQAAASLELLQACALIHDDVIDNSDTRRGAPAAHRRLTELHATSGWDGDSASFGQGAAVLLGDLCLAWCEDMYQSSALPAAALSAGREPFNLMRTEVMAGQYLDLLNQAKGSETVEDALRVMRHKTAKYTIERPMHLGAALAGRGPELAPVYTAYALPLGIAFQLRDDILGVFGAPEETGKPTGDDLREGKRTVLVAETLRLTSRTDAAEFRRLLGDPKLGTDAVDWMRSVITTSGALDACEERIVGYVAEANRALEHEALFANARPALADLILAATERKH